jgi:hypothetical protein
MQTASHDIAHSIQQLDPDSELLRAWSNWLAAARALDLAVDAPDEELEQLARALKEIERTIEGLPARTAAGAAVKLKVVLAAMDGTGTTHRFVTAADPCSQVHAMDFGIRLLWGLGQDLERLRTSSAAA